MAALLYDTHGFIEDSESVGGGVPSTSHSGEFIRPECIEKRRDGDRAQPLDVELRPERRHDCSAGGRGRLGSTYRPIEFDQGHWLIWVEPSGLCERCEHGVRVRVRDIEGVLDRHLNDEGSRRPTSPAPDIIDAPDGTTRPLEVR